MTRRLNWEKLRLAGRRTLSVSREREWRDQDRAARWLAKAEQRRERRPLRQLPLPFERHTRTTTPTSTDWITASSTAEVPW
jgi:hypothetical protein